MFSVRPEQSPLLIIGRQVWYHFQRMIVLQSYSHTSRVSDFNALHHKYACPALKQRLEQMVAAVCSDWSPVKIQVWFFVPKVWRAI